MLLTLLPALLALLPTAFAQSASATSSGVSPSGTAAVPSCALTCVLQSLPGTGCADFGVSNITCICTDTAFQLAYYKCQQTACSASDLQRALGYGASTCSANGTPITTSAVPSGFPGSQTSGASSTGASTSGRSSASSSSSSSRVATGTSSTPAGAASSAAPASAAVKTFGMGSMIALGFSVLATVVGGALLV